jgi:BolA family transcriptional regulator, general stress-responsive regulator
MAGSTMQAIDERVRVALAPTSVELADESAQHAGHAGAASGGGHYRLRIVSARFAGLSRVARHRLVYDSLSDLMRQAIHALAIEALTPDEASAFPAAPTGDPH